MPVPNMFESMHEAQRKAFIDKIAAESTKQYFEMQAEAVRKAEEALRKGLESDNGAAVETVAIHFSDEIRQFFARMSILADQMDVTDFSVGNNVINIEKQVEFLEKQKNFFETKRFPLLRAHKDKLEKTSRKDSFTEEYFAELVETATLLRENFEIAKTKQLKPMAYYSNDTRPSATPCPARG